MKSFIAKHAGKINAILECFDRLILRGHLPLASLGYCLTWMHSRRITLRVHDLPAGWQRFKDVVAAFAERLKTHAKALAEQAGRPYQHLPTHERMEQQARLLAETDGITEGLVCVYSTMETCRTFRVRYGQAPRSGRTPSRPLPSH